MKRIHWFLFMIILLGWGLLEAIEVEGVIGSDTVWSPENNPYQVVGVIEIPERVILTIEPGVRVEFMDYYMFNVYGTLLAEGTDNDSIYFTSGLPEPEDSGSIVFIGESNTNSILTYSVIEYAVYGIRCEQGAIPMIHHNRIENNDIGIYFSLSNPTFRYNLIIDNEIGISCHFSSPEINHNMVLNNQIVGIVCSSQSAPLISQNTINGNVHGITCNSDSLAVILNNIFFNNETGIASTSVPLSIGYNLFWSNENYITGEILPGFGELTELNANGDACDIYYNLFIDPLFIDPANVNYHLEENSPAIDAGNPDHAFIDPDGTVADLGALYYPQGPLIPLADFVASPLLGGAPLAVQFTNLSLYGAETYLWDFGDGEASTESEPLHIYENSGNYSVTLSAYNENGSDTFMKEDYIEVIPGEEALMGSLSGILSNDNIYSVFDDIIVNSGDTLIIEPGVIVRFMDYYSFTISGTLLAEGTETDSIYFTSGQDIPDIDDWEQLKFEGNNSSNSIISYSRIEYNYYGILCENLASPEISNCTFRDNERAGVLCMTSSAPFINNCNIKGQDWGICSNYSYPVISNTIISDASRGFYCLNYSEATVSDCQISNSFYHGICADYYSNLTITDCNIYNNDSYGIYAINNSSLVITGSEIYDNEECGILFGTSQSDEITGSIIRNNGSHGISFGMLMGIDIISDDSPFFPVINNNQILNNDGDGIHYFYNSYPVICYNVITGNNNNGIYKTLISGYDSSTISYNIINNNGETGIYIEDGNINIYNNTICNNNWGMYCGTDEYYSSFVFNNIFYDNMCGINTVTASTSLEYNLFWENDTAAVYIIPPGFGELVSENINGDSCDVYYNLFLDPLFADPENSDYHLTTNSPAVDAGNPAAQYMDHDGTTGDIGALYYDQSDNDENEISEQQTRLLGNYPNPFNPQTTITFLTTENTEDTELNIYNIKGQRISSFKIHNLKSKINSVVWDGTDDNGREMPSGVYLYRLSVGNENETGKMMMIK